MGQVWRIDGIEEVTANINKALGKMQIAGAAGLIRAANYVLNDCDRTPPLVPIDRGILRASRFIGPKQLGVRSTEKKIRGIMSGTAHGGIAASSGTATDPYVEFGYATNYAAAVHEMLSSVSGTPITWKRPGSGPKWLEASLKRNAEIVVSIVGSSIRGSL